MARRNPRLTIIVPIYNAEKHLSACLSSVRRQIFSDWECVCVDNCSSDRSLGIARNIASLDRRFVIVQECRRGVSFARNKGIETASGEWLSFVDADDEIKDDYYARLFEVVDQNVDADVIASSATMMDVDGNVRNRDSHELFLSFNGDVLCRLNQMDMSVVTYYAWDKLVRSSLCINGGIRFDEQLSVGEDILFCQKVIGNSKLVITDFQNRGYVHKFHDGSLSDTIGSKDAARMVFAGYEMIDLYKRTRQIGYYLAAEKWCQGLFESGRRMSDEENEMFVCQLIEYETELMEVIKFLLMRKSWPYRCLFWYVKFLPPKAKRKMCKFAMLHGVF